MKNIKAYLVIILLTLLIISSKSAFSKSPEELLSATVSDEQKGLNIVNQTDKRRLGFESFEADIKMILRNAYGQAAERLSRTKTFEVNDKNLGDKSIIIFDTPADVKGTVFLTFSKTLEADDQWMYLPSIKRVKRISSKNKSGPFMGSEFAFEDIAPQEVGKYSYKYLRSENCPIEEVKDLQCFVIEYKPLYEYSGYSKQIVWIDQKEFRIYKIDFYDRKGDLLKTQINKGYKKYLGKYWYADYFGIVNNQNGESTDLLWSDYRFRTGITESDFNKSKLRQLR